MLAFAYLENLRHYFQSPSNGHKKQDELTRWKEIQSKEWQRLLMEAGFQWDAVEFFVEPLEKLLLQLDSISKESLLERFNGEEMSNGTIVFAAP